MSKSELYMPVEETTDDKSKPVCDFGSAIAHEKHAEFVEKTLQNLFMQFMFTFGCVLLVALSTTMRLFFSVYVKPLLLISVIGSIGTICYMHFVPRMTYEQLSLFTFFETLCLCCSVSFYSYEVVVLALLTTFGVTVCLGTYALTTSHDYKSMGGYLLTGLTSLVLLGFLNLFFRLDSFHLIQLYGGTMLFFAYIVYDVQFFLSDALANQSAVCRPDLDIVAAINIYLDVINIFVRLLELFGKKSKK